MHQNGLPSDISIINIRLAVRQIVAEIFSKPSMILKNISQPKNFRFIFLLFSFQLKFFNFYNLAQFKKVLFTVFFKMVFLIEKNPAKDIVLY